MQESMKGADDLGVVADDGGVVVDRGVVADGGGVESHSESES